MKPGISSLFTKVYRHLLRLYPAEFNAEFGQEMEDVFCAALTSAQQKGFVPPLILPYLHLRFPWQRGLALQGALNLAWLFSIATGAAVSSETGVVWPILSVWFVFLLPPSILGMTRRAVRGTGLVR